MQLRTYRLILVGSLISSFLSGMHVPVLHDILEHGATPQWDVLVATLVLLLGMIAGAWRLLRISHMAR